MIASQSLSHVQGSNGTWNTENLTNDKLMMGEQME
jgi:hypothetical protein